MPNETIKKWAGETDLTVAELETKWEMAEEIAQDKFDKDDDAYYAYVMGIFKKSIPKKELAKVESIAELANVLASGYKSLFEGVVVHEAWECPHCNQRIGNKELMFETDTGEWFHSKCIDKGSIEL